MIRNKADFSYESVVMRVIIQPLIDEDLALFDEYNAIPHTYSQDFLNQLEKLLQKNRLLKSSRGAAKWRKRFAVCFVLILAIALTACVAIKPMRESITEAIISWYSQYVLIQFEEDNSVSVPKKLTYIPEGYELIWATGTEDYNDYYFEYYRKKGVGYLEFTRYSSEMAGTLFDNEHHNISKINIDGIDGIYMEGEEGHPNILTWTTDGYVYDIMGFVDKKELIKMAESVQ